jgi:hypothetical protein
MAQQRHAEVQLKGCIRRGAVDQAGPRLSGSVAHRKVAEGCDKRRTFAITHSACLCRSGRQGHRFSQSRPELTRPVGRHPCLLPQ